MACFTGKKSLESACVCKCEGRVCSGGLQWRASRSSRGVRKEGLKMEGLRHCGDDGNHTGKIEHLAFL